MSELRNLSVKISNYKCFGAEEFGFEGIYPINIVVGKNNVGKTSLIEVIRYLTTYSESKKGPLSKNGEFSRIVFEKPLYESDIELGFEKNVSGGGIPGGNHFNFGKEWINHRIIWALKGKEFKLIGSSKIFPEVAARYFQKIIDRITNPLASYGHIGLLAERDLEPDIELEGISPVSASGQFATNMVWQFVNKRSMPRDLVEVTLLQELNKIFNPDGHFTRILLDKVDTGERYKNKWEIVLVEETKGRIPLSESGSGLKTILLVLIFLHLVPHLEKRQIANFIYVFEELENNLHPSLQKRLFGYLREKALKENGKFIITTHSPVVIDLFSNDPEAQLLHLTHNGTVAKITTLSNFHSKAAALDDLGIKPSDILQANCILWVEGPSDRIYINKWISLITQDKLKENYHYQFLYYGGKLLSHYSAEETTDLIDDLIKVLTLNYNMIFCADSDKKNEEQEIGKTKRRIQEEVAKTTGLFWLTDGREIENYLPLNVITELFNSASRPLEKFEDIKTYLDEIEGGLGAKFERDKVQYAKLFADKFTVDDLQKNSDLFEKVSTVIQKIFEFNDMKVQ